MPFLELFLKPIWLLLEELAVLRVCTPFQKYEEKKVYLEDRGTHPFLCVTDLRIRRQHSSESVSSINSGNNHSNMGSGSDADAKKKKKKNWVNAL